MQDLINDVLVIIFLNVEPKQRGRLREVNRAFEKILSRSSMWADLSKYEKMKYFRLSLVDLSSAQWVVGQFGLTAEDARSVDNYALRWSCVYGHLQITQWFVEYFGLTTEDARSINNDALQWSCKNGHLHVAQWLVEYFGLTAKDARSDNNLALQWSYRDKHYEVTRWLMSFFFHADDDIRDIDVSLLNL